MSESTCIEHERRNCAPCRRRGERMIRKEFRRETRPHRDGVLAFTGILVGALLGAAMWVIIGLVVWVGMEAVK